MTDQSPTPIPASGEAVKPIVPWSEHHGVPTSVDRRDVWAAEAMRDGVFRMTRSGDSAVIAWPDREYEMLDLYDVQVRRIARVPLALAPVPERDVSGPITQTDLDAVNEAITEFREARRDATKDKDRKFYDEMVRDLVSLGDKLARAARSTPAGAGNGEKRARCRGCNSTNVRGFKSPAYGYSLVCDNCSVVSMNAPADLSPHPEHGECADFDDNGNCARCYAAYLVSIGRGVAPSTPPEQVSNGE